MNIQRAKEEIIHTVKAYLAKDALGEYAIPAIRQRPVLLMGPPGIGKTQIMEQVARECGVALVAYTITHHTRQSAVGLPFIRQKHYGDRDVSVTEYTMSEIIASIYDKMEATGLREGILFIDEINCVSETLAPTMLQFLQCKTFGNQAVPAGWIIVAAGNPPEYNKSVRDFDLVTLDRVRRMDIEPDLGAWKEYARGARIHSAILSYLELHPQSFYQINADVDGTQFVTTRGWEDLSNLLAAYEPLGLTADEDVIRQYIQHKAIAEDFAAYLALYYKYRDDYGVEDILAGHARPEAFARLLRAPFDERLSLVGLLLAGLRARFAAARGAADTADLCYAQLREYKQSLALLPADAAGEDFAALLAQQAADLDADTQRLRAAGQLDQNAVTARLSALATLRGWMGALREARPASAEAAFALLREAFGALGDARAAAEEAASAALEAAFDFMEQAFGESQELVIFVTELTLDPAARTFITENGCERYFRYNQSLVLDSRRAALRNELEAEAQRHGEF
jgi:DNA polymerase III delta prime subunit